MTAPASGSSRSNSCSWSGVSVARRLTRGATVGAVGTAGTAEAGSEPPDPPDPAPEDVARSFFRSRRSCSPAFRAASSFLRRSSASRCFFWRRASRCSGDRAGRAVPAGRGCSAPASRVGHVGESEARVVRQDLEAQIGSGHVVVGHGGQHHGDGRVRVRLPDLVECVEQLLPGRVVGVITEHFDGPGQAGVGQGGSHIGHGGPVLGPGDHTGRVAVLAQGVEGVADRRGGLEPRVGGEGQRRLQLVPPHPGHGGPHHGRSGAVGDAGLHLVSSRCRRSAGVVPSGSVPFTLIIAESDRPLGSDARRY